MTAAVSVLKFGSSVLRSPADYRAAAREIAAWLSRGRRVVAVVSAPGRTTDGLMAMARAHAGDPDPRALAALLATGERSSAAVLAIALGAAGVRCWLGDPAQVGLTARGPTLDAEPAGLDVAMLRRLLQERPAVVLPGFFGMDEEQGHVVLLGRGGSDLTAMFVAQRLGASCRLLKDVAGIHDADPAAGPSRRYHTVGWSDVASLGARVVQAKALAYAAAHGVAFEVSAPGAAGGTRVGPFPLAFAP